MKMNLSENPNNFFGNPKKSPVEAFARGNSDVKRLIKKQLTPLFNELGMDRDDSFSIIEKTVQANLQNGLGKLEKELRNALNFNHSNTNKLLAEKFKERALKICKQISEPISRHFKGEPIDVIDVGCGDGLVTKCLHDHFSKTIPLKSVQLIDVFDYLHPDVRTLVKNKKFEFNSKLSEVYDTIPVKQGEFDCVLLLTVLHHCNAPGSVFGACAKLLRKGGIIVVIESCVNVTEPNVSKTPSSILKKSVLKDTTRINGSRHFELVEMFLELDKEKQCTYASFVDWFYNRVLHTDVNVPFNFTSPEEWNKLFRSHKLMLNKVITYYEGFDQKLVPEFHTIHVIEKQ